MAIRILLALGVAAWCWAAEKKPLPPAHAENRLVDITATPYVGKEAVQEALGNDLGGNIVVIQLKITPKGTKPLVIDRDDFMLRSDKDGQKSQPFAPSQIAGRGALVVRYEAGGDGGGKAQSNGPVWGGMGGGMPGRLPGNGGSMGSATANTETAKAEVKSGSTEKEDPLLKTLKEKVLPEKETKEPVSGMLYFLMEGKQKVKDLELLYKTPAGSVSLRFPH